MGMPAGVAAQGAGGRFVGTRGLTEKQAEFVRSYVRNGGKGVDAAKSAGYSGDCRSVVWQNLRLPSVVAAIKAYQIQLFEGEITSLALGTIKEALQDQTLSMQHRATLAVKVVTHNLPKAPEAPSSDQKSPSDMSIEELEELVMRGRQQLADRAKPVIDGQAAETTPNATPNPTMIDAKPLIDNDE